MTHALLLIMSSLIGGSIPVLIYHYFWGIGPKVASITIGLTINDDPCKPALLGVENTGNIDVYIQPNGGLMLEKGQSLLKAAK